MILAGSLIAVKGGTLISQGAGLENLLNQNGKPNLQPSHPPSPLLLKTTPEMKETASFPSPVSPASQPILTRKQFSVSLPLLISKHRKKKLGHRTEQKCLQMTL